MILIRILYYVFFLYLGGLLIFLLLKRLMIFVEISFVEFFIVNKIG